MQPYTLRLERSSSSGAAITHYGSSNSVASSSASLAAAAAAAVRSSAASVGGKPQITVHTTMAHHLASKLLLQKQPSLDDRMASSADLFTTEFGKFVRRQRSVENNEKKKQQSISRQNNIANNNNNNSGINASVQENVSELERKVKHSMINLFGALTAVEQGNLDSLRVILSKNCFALNVCLEYGLYGYFTVPLTLLDVALMLGRNAAAELLLDYGAAENPQLAQIEQRRRAISAVLCGSFDRLKALRDKQNPSKEDEKRMRLLESQISTIKKMKMIVEQQAPLPGPPINVRAFVSSGTRATVEFGAPQNAGPSIVIKYKIEWSRTPSFEIIEGSFEVGDMRKTRVNVENLEHGGVFSFRVAAATIFGYGEFAVASPRSLCISSWEDVNETPNFRVQQMHDLVELFEQVERHRQSTVWQRVFPQNVDVGVKKKKSGLRYLFSASSKFVKNVQRGVYLASVIYTESKVLCTVDDCLPVLSVDENISTVSTEDLHWLMKLSLCWDQVPYLLESVNTTSVSNASQLRVKLLEAITSMMNALGVRDIGRVHHLPLVFSNGVTFIVSVNLVNENQTVQGLAMRWIRMEKLLRKKSSLCPSLEYLNKELFSIINFFESSQIPLDAGLYLSYLRLESSLNVIRVTVPENVPSVLPFSLIRQNPHVSSEEWQWLQQLDALNNAPTTNKDGTAAAAPQPLRPTPLQYTFHQQLGRAASVLVHDLDMKAEQVQNHRLFRLQVLQLHSDVCFILIMPKAEDVCHVNPGYGAHEETYSENFRGCASIPAPVFQMINLFTYQPDFITAYCRLSIFIEHFIMILQCEQRQCLLENDSKVYADQLEKLADFQQRLDTIWRASRWISNIASVARDRQVNCAIPLAQIILPPASAPLVPGINNNVAPGGFDDSADIGYHSDQSAEKFASSRTNVTENFTQCNEQVRARLRASKLYNKTNSNNNKDESNKNLRNSAHNEHTNNNKKEAADENDCDDFETAWKGRNRSRRHSEKNIRHTSLISLRKPSSDYPNAQGSVKSSDSFAAVAKKKKASIVSLIQNSLVDSSKKVYAATMDTDRPTVSQQEAKDGDVKQSSALSLPVVHNTNVSASSSVAPDAQPQTILSAAAKHRPPPLKTSVFNQNQSTLANVYQRQRRPISMYAPSTSSGAATSLPSTPLSSMNSATSNASPLSRGITISQEQNDTFAPPLTGSPSTPVKSSIVRVYVAYECGLENGASVRLKITNETTAREIVALVVEQIAKVVGSPPELRSDARRNTVGALAKPNETNSQQAVDNFCLVSIVGSAERRLRDSFPLMRLQSPWNTGRLFVRHVNCIPAASYYGNEAYV